MRPLETDDQEVVEDETLGMRSLLASCARGKINTLRYILVLS